VTVNEPITRAAKEVTRTVPIVAILSNPVEGGVIQSLARPGGNITGFTVDTDAAAIFAKKIQLLKELLPGMSRAAILQDKAEMPTAWEQGAKAANRALGAAPTQQDYTAAFRAHRG
jgi:putative ABC transport system substrate-binding protein